MEARTMTIQRLLSGLVNENQDCFLPVKLKYKYLLGLDILARPIGVLHLQTPVLHHLTPPTPAEF